MLLRLLFSQVTKSTSFLEIHAHRGKRDVSHSMGDDQRVLRFCPGVPCTDKSSDEANAESNEDCRLVNNTVYGNNTFHKGLDEGWTMKRAESNTFYVSFDNKTVLYLILQ